MILLDFSQIILATLFASIGNHKNIQVDESMIRHMCLNVIRSVRKKYHSEYGELVICADGKNSWRKSIFPYYKANRKKSREESELDWDHLFSIINTIRDELSEYFPYKVIHLDHVEADDVIGTLCHEFGTVMCSGEKILIYSSDKDYIQLQVYGNVVQYNPLLKKRIYCEDPEQYLVEHIIKGDTGDGIPNILSADNCLVLGERQRSVTAKRLAAFSESEANMDESTRSRWYRNKMLIDLSQVPQKYRDAIMVEYNKPAKDRKKLFNYFIGKGLKNLLGDIQDF